MKNGAKTFHCWTWNQTNNALQVNDKFSSSDQEPKFKITFEMSETDSKANKCTNLLDQIFKLTFFMQCIFLFQVGQFSKFVKNTVHLLITDEWFVRYFFSVIELIFHIMDFNYWVVYWRRFWQIWSFKLNVFHLISFKFERCRSWWTWWFLFWQ